MVNEIAYVDLAGPAVAKNQHKPAKVIHVETCKLASKAPSGPKVVGPKRGIRPLGPLVACFLSLVAWCHLDLLPNHESLNK